MEFNTSQRPEKARKNATMTIQPSIELMNIKQKKERKLKME